ncbi:SGNH/GDSL hydrolase family protein [Heyndrickxia oleronia]
MWDFYVLERKMKKFIVFLVALMSIGVIFFGYKYWGNIEAAAEKEGRLAIEKINKKERIEKELLIDRLNPETNQTQSFIDFLRYRFLTKNKAVISIIGGNIGASTGASTLSNTWTEQLFEKLQADSEELEALQIVNYSSEGYSTSDLLNGGKIDLVIKDQPDLVILGSSLINNYSQSISLEQTTSNLKNIMSKLQTGLPNSKIVIMSPYPIGNSKNKNSLGLSYLDYLNHSSKLISQNKWDSIDVFKEIENQLTDRNILLVDILANDYIHLNDKGNILLYEVVYKYLNHLR